LGIFSDDPNLLIMVLAVSIFGLFIMGGSAGELGKDEFGVG